MKKLIYIIAGVLFLGTTAASAQKTGHVNSQELVLSLPDYKVAEAEIKKYRDEMMGEYDKMKAKYDQMVQTFEKEAPTLTDAIKQTRYADIMDYEKRLGEFEQNTTTNLQKKEQTLMDPMVKKVKDAIAKVAKAQGINYVLDTGTLVYFDGGNDLQPMVKKELGLQ